MMNKDSIRKVSLMRITASTLFTVVLIGTAHAQQGMAPSRLALSEAVEIGLERNLSVLQSANNVDAASSAVLAAYGGYLPTVNASGGWNRQQTDRAASTQLIGGQPFSLPASFSVNNSFSTSLSVGYTVFDGLSREANVSRAGANRSSAIEVANRTRQAVVFQIESAYLNVLRTEQLVRVSEENLKRGRHQLQRIEESNRLGALSIADVYRQQSVVAADELALINAQNNHNKAKADLAALIGLDMSKEYEFVDASISAEISPEELKATTERYASFEELWRRAIASRPDFRSARESYNAASAGVVAARRSYFPSLSAFGRYSMSNETLESISRNKTIGWGLSLSWNLFDGFQTNQAVQSALVQERNAELSLAQSERNIAVEVKKALLDLDAATKQYEVAQKGLVSAVKDRTIAEERYNVGSGTLLDLLTANAGLVNAEANKINASYNYIVARRNTEFALGERQY